MADECWCHQLNEKNNRTFYNIFHQTRIERPPVCTGGLHFSARNIYRGWRFIFWGIFCPSEKKAVKSSYVKCGTCRCLTSDLPASPSSSNVRLGYISETRRSISFGKDDIEEGLSGEFRKGIHHKQMRGRVTWRSFRFSFLVVCVPISPQEG